MKSAGAKSMYIILCTVMPLETLICRLSHEVSLKWIMMDFSKTNPKTLSPKKSSPKHRCLGFLMFLANVGCFKIGDPKHNLPPMVPSPTPWGESWSAAALFRTAAVISINTELKDSRILGDPRMVNQGGWFKEGGLCCTWTSPSQ